MKTPFFLFLSIGLYLLAVGCQHDARPRLPEFKLLLKDSATILNTSDIPGGKPIVMVFYSPDCEHCQQETEDILRKMDSLNQVRFYFITADPFERMDVFREHYDIDKYHNIVLGWDFESFFSRHFKILSPPCSVVYTKQKKLKAVFAGEVTATELIKVLNDI